MSRVNAEDMPSVTFRIHYATRLGEHLSLDWKLPAPNRLSPDHRLVGMQHDGDGLWSVRLPEIDAGATLEAAGRHTADRLDEFDRTRHDAIQLNTNYG